MKGIKNKIRQVPYLRWILIISNWIFQGIINADRTEKIYKLLFTIILSVILFAFLDKIILSHFYTISLSFLIAHTINWLVNGNISTIIIHRLFIGTVSRKKIFCYLKDLQERLQKTSSIEFTAVFGSISRGELKNSSDIDITFVRKDGFINSIKAIIFIIKEKFHTNINKIPIEPFLADSINYMKKRYRDDEVPVVIKNSKKISNHYKKSRTLSEAAQINSFDL